MLYGPCGVRGFPEPESSHPKWGDFSRALESSGLNGSAMKGSIVCNYGSGPFMSGSNQCTIKQAAQSLMDSVGPEFLDRLSDQVAFDRGLKHWHLSKDDWMETRSIARRIKYDCDLNISWLCDCSFHCYLCRAVVSHATDEYEVNHFEDVF